MLKEKIKNIFTFLPNIGIQDSDSENLKLQKRFLNAQALLMSNGGLLWAGISLHFNLYIAASIPTAYFVLTALNLGYFHVSKNFPVVRTFQVFISLLLPFLFQWSLGGIVSSGAMMIWALLALVASMSFQDVKASIKWLITYLVLVVFSGIIDEATLSLAIEKTPQITALFFVINILVVSAIIVGLMLYFVNSRNLANEKLKTLNISLEDKVLERTSEISAVNENLNNLNEELRVTIDQVQEQSVELKHKNKKITDSINYAKRIQDALLSNSDNHCSALDSYFIFFKPRDIVSGDFYWISCKPEQNKIIVAAVDCTGHGVPGAFMSLIGDSLLNKIVLDQSVEKPHEILNLMDIGIQKALNQQESDSRDGMDMAIAIIDFKEKTLEYAGAKNPLIYIQENELHSIKGDIFSIGSKLKNGRIKTFTTHKITFEKPTTVYMYSDGFQDQLGGPYMRKYLSRNFKKLLHHISSLPVPDQREVLYKEFMNWKKETLQTDDVLVIGLELK